MTSFSIQSFGCRVNQAEAFQWTDELQKHGFKYEKDVFRSDLVLVNTCTLTARADRDVTSFIRKIGRLNPHARLVITGCYIGRDSGDLKKNTQVWQVIPNPRKEEVVSSVLSLPASKENVRFESYRSRALVKVQDGCDYRCTFCVIPGARGKSVSIPKGRILEQIRTFIKQGFYEIVLTGVHLCQFGGDLEPRSTLLDLLREITSQEGLGRVRLSSLDPRFMSKALMEFITSHPKICPHFHLSLQHGSDGILRRMGRNVTVSDYRRITRFLKEEAPDASLGADIISGFPGESEEDFASMFDFLENVPLDYYHVFTYSPRPGTLASKWPQIMNSVKTHRSASLRGLSRQKRGGFLDRFVGRELEAVVIKKEKKNAVVLTSNYINVFVPECSVPAKKAVSVKITGIKNDKGSAEGEIV